VRSPALFTAGLLAAACSTTTPYPTDWAQPQDTEGCPVLTGAFDNHGDWVLDDDHDQRLLASIFFPLVDLEANAVTHVSFNVIDGTTVARAWVGPVILAERELSDSELGCQSNALIYHDSGWAAEGQIGAAAKVHSVYTLRRTHGGELVMSQNDSWAGVIVVVPVAGKALTWLRFKPFDPGTSLHARGPRGVRSVPQSIRSLRPPEGARKWSAYEQAKRCLILGQAFTDAPLSEEQLRLLDGHSTQAFVLGKKNVTAWPNGIADKEMGWIPAEHSYQVEKLNWELPAFTDHYVLCLLEQGYSWE